MITAAGTSVAATRAGSVAIEDGRVADGPLRRDGVAMAGRVRVALAGLGRMGRIHAANLAHRSPSAQLAAVVDADAATARRVGEELGVPWGTSYDDVLADGSVDAMAIATPTATHADLVVRAARAGRPVFCEKPISLDRAATVETLTAVREAGVALQVGFHRRFDPDWVAAVQRIRPGELGDVRLLRSSPRDMAPPSAGFLRGSGGFFLDMAIHDLDLARWMVGEVAEVYAYGSAVSAGAREMDDLDTAVVVLRFANGALGVLDSSRQAGYGYECSTEVMGSRATVRIDNPRRRQYEWRTPGQAAYGLVADFEERFPEAYELELEDFARCVLEGREPRVTGRDALAAYDLARAAERSWRTHAPVVIEPG